MGRAGRFTTAPLDGALEIAGHPMVSLWLVSSEPGAVFLYLSEVEADGAVCYVTEGVLRAIHRAEVDHFVQTPHGRPPLPRVPSGGEQAIMLELPVG